PKNTKKLLLIPDGALHYIPFQALIEHPITNSKIEQARFDTLSYLTKKYAISYAYSSNLLLYMQAAKSKKKLIFGGFAPIFSGGKVVALRNTQLNELPHSQTEVEHISRLLQGKTYFKQSASLENFKTQASNFNILHLSTHAALDDQNPSQSRIHLYDDYITVNEIYNLPIQADLTVLSACETGVGEFKRGEGLLSLARAFMYAGCPSLVTSLWQVNDQKTASLMIEFYRQLNNSLSKDEALQSAQINYLNNLSSAQAAHPFYWAAFVQTGNSDALVQRGFSWYWLFIIPIFFLLGIMLRKKIR
ncbi:MAG: CHAT domain-containing protein, partial [Bacteroidota bacterium]